MYNKYKIRGTSNSTTHLSLSLDYNVKICKYSIYILIMYVQYCFVYNTKHYAVHVVVRNYIK